VYSARSVPFDVPKKGKIAVKVLNHAGTKCWRCIPTDEISGVKWSVISETLPP
jgi:hypothetical protein